MQVSLLLPSLAAAADAAGGEVPPQSGSGTYDSEVIYGNDDRINVYHETHPDRLEWTRSVCALVPKTMITRTRSPRTVWFSP